MSSPKAKKSVRKEFHFSTALQKKLESLITDPERTQLEGVRAKVFRDRYSLKDDSGKGVEEYPEQMWTRVAAGLAQVEKTPEAQKRMDTKVLFSSEGF